MMCDSMNDAEVDTYITRRLEEKDVCLQDMIGPKYIDPDPENKIQHWNERARWNRFSYVTGELRMCELLTEGKFNSNRPYDNLGVASKDIIRYWWNNIVDREAILDVVFDEIFTEYKDRMLPDEPEEELPDHSEAFDELLEAV